MNRPAPTDPTTSLAQPATDVLNQDLSSTGDAVRKVVARVSDVTQRSVGQWRDGASEHIRAHPMRSVLIATGTGMLLTLLLRALRR